MGQQKTTTPNKIYVTKPSMPPLDEYVSEIEELWRSGILTHSGIKHQTFEAQLKETLDVPFVSLFTNGHLGLEAALSAFELKGEVITSPFTFASTTLSIIRSGLKPVFCDIRPDDYTIDPMKIESLITEKTSAIVPVHVYGNICDVDGIEKIAYKHGLKIIYDAAHGFGETLNGKSIASYGDASMFSFHATKVLNTGEGGAVVCQDADIKSKLDAWKYYGFESSGGEIFSLGTNAKMTEFAAAMGLCNLRHFYENMQKRSIIADHYYDLLTGVEGIRLCKLMENTRYNHAYFAIAINSQKHDRNAVNDFLNQSGIYPRKYFYPLTSEYVGIKQVVKGNPQKETPIAYQASREILTLPIYADLSIAEVDRICSVLVECLD